MGRQGNLVLVGENGKVIDAIHRVDFAASESRPLLSGLEYCYPPRQDKLDLTVTTPLDAADRLLSGPDLPLSKALLAVLEGASPLICRELSYRIAPGDPTVSALSPVQRATVSAVLGEWAAALAPEGGTPLLLGGEKPDFTFLPQRQYEGTNITQTPYPTCSELLEEFYRLKTGSEGVKLAGEGLRRQVTSIHERLLRKRTVRLQELEKSAGRDQLRLYGDLLSANLYRLEKGMTALTCEDYTADPPVNVTIPLEGRLTPSRNVQKYYTEYRKAANAEAVLRRLITECEEEIAYIESVQEALRRATTEGELLEIREELRQQGYLKTLTPKGQKPLQKRRGGTLPPLRYRSSDGYTILCGRNNLQNDQLTLKTAHGSDLWFHIQKQPGSHVILLTGGTPLEELPDQTIEEAAMLAACNSSGRESSRVPIDYTLVKNIKKPNGARPGMVIYETYYTMLTTPDHATAQKPGEGSAGRRPDRRRRSTQALPACFGGAETACGPDPAPCASLNKTAGHPGPAPTGPHPIPPRRNHEAISFCVRPQGSGAVHHAAGPYGLLPVPAGAAALGGETGRTHLPLFCGGGLWPDEKL